MNIRKSKKNQNKIMKKEIRKDILIKDIEKKYDVDFGVDDNTKLKTYLKNKGLPSLSKALSKITNEKRKNRK